MYAIIEDSGTQIKVSPGDVLEVDRRDLDEQAKTVTFDHVLLVGSGDDTKAATIGTPYVAGASVTADVLGPVKGEKIDVIKFKRRKGYRVKQGHRQPHLRVQIKNITAK